MVRERACAASSLGVAGNLTRDVKPAGLSPGDHLFRDDATPVAYVAETIGGGGANGACPAAARAWQPEAGPGMGRSA